jgi:histidinol-phosphate phosphatase family protein
MKLQAVFIDRDGTIGGSEKVEYPGELSLFPYTQQSIFRLKNAGIKGFSFTNHPGISRGEAHQEDFVKELLSFGFDDVYICPHQQDAGCDCRKPAPGMLLQGAENNGLHLDKCAVIDDRWTDMIAAEQAGCMKILVKTGAGAKVFNKYQNKEYDDKWAEIVPDYIADTLEDAVNWLFKDDDRE